MDMGKNNTIVNGIKLQDGRIIQGYPIQHVMVEEAKETPVLDKTGGYFSIRKKPAKPKPTDEEERNLQKLFTDNSFLILANRKRILNDSRMLLTPVTVRNGLAYTGAFSTATLGVYIEWWHNCPYSVLFGEKDDTMSLIWYLSGSPLSGGNLCSMVTEDGKAETVRVHFFRKLWPKFTDILADYHDAKELYQAYTLPEVIDILKRETTKEFYTESIKEFRYQAKVNLLNAQLRDWEENYESLKEKCDKYEKEWHFALFQLKKEEIAAFHKEYNLRKENLQNRKEELAKENQELKRKLRHGELTNKEYQPLLSANKKEIRQREWDLDEYANESISTLVPKLAEGAIGFSFGYLDKILSEIAEFVKSSSL
ncbi:hypothetical protein [Leyella lascolaii]|uniref:hypothetical protein n=1 Tax=Leyella lascolaii TaxID=1776379 RepID=UPI002355DE62|nr:hypothetical protein [Leyella lascolaii]